VFSDHDYIEIDRRTTKESFEERGLNRAKATSFACGVRVLRCKKCGAIKEEEWVNYGD
jgi:hypothetical protein